MKYGVISDTHDNLYNFERAVKILRKRDIKTCFHLGDYCSPGFIKNMGSHEEINWIGVWGNVDGDKVRAVQMTKDCPNFDIVPETFREVETKEGRIFLTHFPRVANIAARSGEFFAVFHGHNHTKHTEKLENGTLLANPGEIVGSSTGQPSFGIWDSKTNEIEIINLTDFKIPK